MLNLENLDQVGLAVTVSWFTLLVVLLECLTSLGVKPIFVQSCCGSLSRVDTLDWLEFSKLKVYVTNIYFLMEKDWCVI